MNYYFEMVQKLKFTVYDVDNETKKLEDDDFLGSMECTLGQVSLCGALCMYDCGKFNNFSGKIQ